MVPGISAPIIERFGRKIVSLVLSAQAKLLASPEKAKAPASMASSQARSATQAAVPAPPRKLQMGYKGISQTTHTTAPFKPPSKRLAEDDEHPAVSATVATTAELCAQGLSLAEICHRRSLVPGTVLTHLSMAMQAGIDIDMKRLGIPEQDIKDILDVAASLESSSPFASIPLIKSRLKPHIDFCLIKLVLTSKHQTRGASAVPFRRPR